MTHDIKTLPQSMIEAAMEIQKESTRRDAIKEQVLAHYGVESPRALPHERLALFTRDLDRAITEGVAFLTEKEIDIKINDDDDKKDDDKKDDGDKGDKKPFFAKKDDGDSDDDSDDDKSDDDKKAAKKSFFKKLKEARYSYSPQATSELTQKGGDGEPQKSLKKISGKDVEPPYITKSKTKEVNPFGKFVKEEFHKDFLV
jgi:hypothetical protein